MGDEKEDRRRFLKGLVTGDEDEEKSKGDGWKPGFQPLTEGEMEENRRKVRQQLGEIDEPEEAPLDAREYLEGLGKETDEESSEESSGRSPGSMPLHRPPRALDEEDFLDVCTRCGDCVDACPHDAIELAGPRFREARETPVINASRQPCWMCSDTPCVTACEPGALRHGVGLSMGDAAIQRQDCIAHRGGMCSVCVERCPVPGAIKVRDGRPTIRQAACTGCGVCHFVCPAPVNAVRIFPKGIPEEVRDE